MRRAGTDAAAQEARYLDACWPTWRPACRWSGAAGAQRVHRRRHAQPVRARSHRPPDRRHARAPAAGAGLRDHAGSQPRHLRARALPRPSAPPASRACRSACRASTTRSCAHRPRARRRAGACRAGRGRARLRHLQPRPDVRAARPESGRAGADVRHGAVLRAAAPVDLPPDGGAEHGVRQVPAGAARRGHGLGHARPHHRATAPAGLARYEVSAYARPATAACTT
jgi:hypothetical protein